MNAHVFTTTRVVSAGTKNDVLDTDTGMTVGGTPLRRFIKFATLASVCTIGAICVLAFKIPPVALPLAVSGGISADTEADNFGAQLIKAGENSRFNVGGHQNDHHDRKEKKQFSTGTTIALAVCGLVTVVGAVVGIMWCQGCRCFDDSKYWHLAPYRQTACAGGTAITTKEECMTAGMLIRGKVQAIVSPFRSAGTTISNVKDAVGNPEEMVVPKDDAEASKIPLGCSIMSRSTFTVVWKGEGDTPAADTVLGVQPICVGKGNRPVDSPLVEISWGFSTHGDSNVLII